MLGAIGGAIGGAINGLTGGGSGGGGAQVDFGALEATFAKATADTAKITQITTEGNVAKDAAAQRPR
ncbi:MAG: hypothetical protein AAGA21_02955 [Pseudomonadota bacterium]